MKQKNNILIISDMCGYGKVSAAVQMPILSYMGHDVYNLPTMLISNTFPYGKYAILESTSYIEEALQKWNELGIHFDAITTGFMVSEHSSSLLQTTSGKGNRHFCRPSDGRLWQTVWWCKRGYNKMYAGDAERGSLVFS